MCLIWIDLCDINLIHDNKPVVNLIYTSSGSMPELLNTSQIDAFIVYEPIIASTVMGGIGKEIATGADMPPPGEWNNSACNVLVLSNDFVSNNHEYASIISALMNAGIKVVNEDPDLAENISAEWVYGSGTILTAGTTLDPLAVEKQSIPNLSFTPYAEIPDISSTFNLTDNQRQIIVNLMNETGNNSVFNRGLELLSGSEPVITNDSPVINIGYLPSSDNYAPLYVVIKDSDYFCNNYDFCLVPSSKGGGRPTKCDLLVKNRTVAYVNLIPGSSGGGLMTNMGQRIINVGCLGSIPAEEQIVSGNPATIIQSINAGGSGILVNNRLPCSDWKSFVSYIKQRSVENNPVKIATVQSSLQEQMIRQALKYENITISMK